MQEEFSVEFLGSSPTLRTEQESSGRDLPDIHFPNEPILNLVNMLHEAIDKHFSGQVADRLVHCNSHAAVFFRIKPDWFDMWIHQTPLPCPVLADSGMATDASALHSIRPIHILVHRLQSTVEIPLIEERVRSDKQFLTSYRHRFPLVLTS